MLSTALNTTPVLSNKVAPAPHAPSDQFQAITGHIGLVASEFAYERDEEIFGEDEPAEYVYQVVSGAVRTYKLLSDARHRRLSWAHARDGVAGALRAPSERRPWFLRS